MIDVSHDRHHRRPQNKRLRIVLDLRDLRRIDFRRQRFRSDAKLAGHQRRRIIIDLLIDRRHDAHQKQLFHDFGRRVTHLAGQILDRNRLADLNILRTRDLYFRLRRSLITVLTVTPSSVIIIAIECVASIIVLSAPAAGIIVAVPITAVTETAIIIRAASPPTRAIISARAGVPVPRSTYSDASNGSAPPRAIHRISAASSLRPSAAHWPSGTRSTAP